MTAVYCFAIFWFCFTGFTMYKTFCLAAEDGNQEDFYDELAEMGRVMAPGSIATTMRLFILGLLIIDVTGFCLTYFFAYANEPSIYHRILLFIVFVGVFCIDQLVTLRHIMRLSAVIKLPDIEPRVLQRWFRLNEPTQGTMDCLATVTKFTAAFQLLLYTVITAFNS